MGQKKSIICQALITTVVINNWIIVCVMLVDLLCNFCGVICLQPYRCTSVKLRSTGEVLGIINYENNRHLQKHNRLILWNKRIE